MDRNKIVFVVFTSFLIGCINHEESPADYIKELDKYSIQEARVKKYLIDPSYNYPYNVYMKITMDSSSLLKLIKELHLVNSFGEDSVTLKRYSPPDEYKFFFSMNSINKERNSSMEKEEKGISWWP